MRKCLLIILTFITLISCSKSPDELKKDSERFLNQALDYYERGYLSQSAELFEKVIEIEDKLGNLERKANCYIYLGLINYQISDFNKAKNNYQKALEIFRQRNDKKNELLVLNNIAGIYSILGKYNDAIKIYSDVLGKSLIFADKESEAIVSLNLGELYQELWDFEKSFDYFNRAYDAYEILGDVKGKLYTLKKISDLFILSKNYPNAIKTIDMAFELSKKNGVKYLTQEFYNNLGLIYFYENQVSKAKEIFELALNSSPASESNQHILISIKNNLGDCEFRGQSYSQALKHYFEALSFSENSFLKFISPIIQLKIGKSYEELYLLNKNESDRKNAERYFQFALNRFKENRDLKNLQKALSIVASFYSKINELDKAKKYFFDLDEINLLIELKPEDFLKTFAIKPEYEFDFLNVAVNQNKELAYKIFQNLKFQNVFEYFLKFRDFNFLDGDLSKVFNSLREEILVKNTYEKIYIQEISLPSAQRINEKIKIAKEELSKTNEKVEELISNLASTYQALNTIFEKKTQLDFISNNEQIFVELIPTNENLICFYVSKTGIQVKTIKIDLENLRFNLKTLFQNLNSFTQDELKEFSSTNFGAIADEIISGVINSNSRIRKITFLLNGSDLDFLPHLFYSKKFEQFISEKFSVDYSIFISDDGKISEIKSIGFLKNGKILSNDELISKVNRSDEKSSREKISQRQIRVGLPKKEEIQENKSELNNKNFDFVVTIDNLILNSTSPELNYFDSASRYYFKELLKTKPKFLLLKSVSIDNINLFYLFFSQFYFGKINYIVLPVTKSSQEITDNFLYNYAKRVENKTPLASLNEFFELLKTDKNNIKQNNYWIIYQN